MSIASRSLRIIMVLVALAAPALAARRGLAAEPAAAPAPPDSIVIVIGNRLFPDFREIVTTGLRERRQIGDTDFFFEVRDFYPHFSIIDSTRSIVSLSDEPRNPAFRIRIFENEAVVDSAWAFYLVNAPHFSRTAALWFQVLAFDYRGVVFKKEPPAAAKTPAKEPGSAPDQRQENP
jgi:hypothetical protein